MNMKIRKWNQSVFGRFLGSIFFALIVPFLILLIVYFSLNRKLITQTYERNMGGLESCVEKMELLYENMDQISSYLSGNSAVLDFYNIREDSLPRKLTDVLAAQKALSGIRVGNNDILNIQLYSGQSDLLVDCFTNAIYLERYYNSSFGVDGMNVSRFREQCLKPQDYLTYDYQTIMLNKNQYDVLVYSRRLMNYKTKGVSDKILFYIEKERLLGLFESLRYTAGGFLYLLEDNGEVIFADRIDRTKAQQIDVSEMKDEKGYLKTQIEGREMYLTWYRSTERGWLCVEAVPETELLAVTEGFQQIMVLLLVLAIVAGIGLILRAAQKLSAPVSEIGLALGRQRGAGDRLPMEDYVIEVKRLIENNSVLMEKMQQQVAVMKTDVFHRLLNGTCGETETAELLDLIGLKRDSARYVLLLLTCNDMNVNAKLEDISAQKVFLENAIRKQQMEEIQDIYHIDFTRMVVFLAFGEKSERSIREQVEGMIVSARETISRDAIYSISVGGDVVEELHQLPEAYVNAQKALNIPQNVFGTSPVQWYDRVEQYMDMKTYELNAKEKSPSLQSLVIVERIKEYIGRNYSDSQLSLSQVGEEFGITEVYLSKLFKQITGENFSKYVEGIRMEKAKELLDDGQKVTDVAAQVGYNSPQVFRRAWKRYYG